MADSVTFPALQHLLQGYLHYDWPEDYGGDPWAAVDDFASDESVARDLAEEITEALRLLPSERELRTLVFDHFDSGYLPEADGYTLREWLIAVRVRVEAALAGRS